MKAIIKGIIFEGTPEEMALLMKAMSNAEQVKERLKFKHYDVLDRLKKVVLLAHTKRISYSKAYRIITGVNRINDKKLQELKQVAEDMGYDSNEVRYIYSGREGSK
jgi:MoaA/NifB/PqqE/SkfB family radical SAM enzyme